MLYEKEDAQEYKEEVDSVDDEGDSVVIRQEVSKEKRKFIFRWMEIYIIIMVFIVCALVRRSLERDENGQEEQEEQEEQGKNIFTQVEEIEDKYGINIMWEGRCDEQRVSKLSEEPDLTYDEEKIRFALDEMEIIMARFPEGFFAEYKKESVLGDGRDCIDFYLCESLLQSDDIVDSIQLGAMNFYHTSSRSYVYIDVNQKKNFKFTFAHELFHVIESKIGYVSIVEASENNDLMTNIYTKWEKCNPDDYSYISYENNHGEIHVFDVELPYDIDVEDIGNVYFVNKYAQFSDEEDRAETFSYLIACDDADHLPQSYNSPHVKEKAKLLVEMIDDTFDCVDDDAYWARMYHEKYGDV